MLPREADTAEHLDGGRADPVEPVGGERRGDRGRAVALGDVGRVAGPRRVVRGGATELDRAQHVRAEVLDGLERADRPAELLPLLRVLEGQLERAGCGTDPVEHERDGEAVAASRRAPPAVDPPSGRASAPARVSVANLRVPSTVSSGVTATPGCPGTTAATGGSETPVATSSRSAATPSGTCTFVPWSRPSLSTRTGSRPGVGQRDGSHVLAGREAGQPLLGHRVGGQVGQEADRADGTRGEGPREHGAPHLLEREREVDHARPGAARRFGREHPREAEVGETPPRRRRRPRARRARRGRRRVGARSVRYRRTESRRRSWSSLNSKSTPRAPRGRAQPSSGDLTPASGRRP